MNKYIIVADSTTDLPVELVDNKDLIILPLSYTINDKTYKNYLDYKEQNIDEFYQLLEEGNQATTSQLNPVDYEEALTPILEKGYDVILLTLSSKLSGTYNSARLATLELSEKFKDRQIILIDSKSASLGFGYLTMQAVYAKRANKTIEEVANFINDLIPKVAHWFTVDDINHLRRGGRISAVSSVVAKTLRIKPILYCNEEGALVARTKALSRKRAIKSLFNKMIETGNKEQKLVYIGHGDDIDAANTLAGLIKNQYKEVEILIHNIGPVIGAHTGKGVLALFFEAENRG